MDARGLFSGTAVLDRQRLGIVVRGVLLPVRDDNHDYTAGALTLGLGGQTLAKARVNIVAIAQTASERNISVVVARDQAEEAVRQLHKRFVSGEK